MNFSKAQLISTYSPEGGIYYPINEPNPKPPDGGGNGGCDGDCACEAE